MEHRRRARLYYLFFLVTLDFRFLFYIMVTDAHGGGESHASNTLRRTTGNQRVSRFVIRKKQESPYAPMGALGGRVFCRFC